MSGHSVRIETRCGELWATELICDEPDESLCHATWDCTCETLYEPEIIDGIPVHRNAPVYGDLHAGIFGKECNHRNWFNNTDGNMAGEITLPVTSDWMGDSYTFDITPKEESK